MDKYEERFFSIDVRADDNGGFNSSTELLVRGCFGLYDVGVGLGIDDNKSKLGLTLKKK